MRASEEPSKLVRCTACVDFLRLSRLHPTKRNLTVADLKDRPDDPEREVWAMRYLGRELLKARAGMLTLSGQCGDGKTQLLQALVAEFCRLRVEARFYTAPEIADMLMPSEDNDPTVIVGILKRLPVVAIDELDKIEWTPWRWQMLGEVINYRSEPAHGLATVLAMNLEPAQWLAKPGVSLSAIESRMADGRFNRYWPEELVTRLPACLAEHYDDAGGRKRYYAPGWFKTTLPDIRPNLREGQA